MGNLQNMLILLFESFKNNNISYCILGNYDMLPKYTENDVDIWVEDISKAEKILKEISKTLPVKKYLYNKTANGSNNYFYYFDEHKKIKLIKIDFMHETAYKSIFPIVKKEMIKSNRKKYKNFLVANELIEGIMHLFYPLVTFGIIKKKYREKLSSLIDDSNFQNHILKIIGKKKR